MLFVVHPVREFRGEHRKLLNLICVPEMLLEYSLTLRKDSCTLETDFSDFIAITHFYENLVFEALLLMQLLL